MWNKYINNSSLKCLEIEKNDQVCGCEKWQKMTENDKKWHKYATGEQNVLNRSEKKSKRL